MNDNSYKQLREAMAKGPTPGPWTFWRHTSDLEGTHSASDDWSVYGPDGKDERHSICFEGARPALADPEYIAAAHPGVISQLLAERDQYAAELTRLLSAGEITSPAVVPGLVLVEGSATPIHHSPPLAYDPQDWTEPHPPSRQCMCPACIPSFDERFAPVAEAAWALVFWNKTQADAARQFLLQQSSLDAGRLAQVTEADTP